MAFGAGGGAGDWGRKWEGKEVSGVSGQNLNKETTPYFIEDCKNPDPV